jgi:hypothetical protein
VFITKEEITQQTGYEIDTQTLALANLMIETWVGRSESDVEDAGDQAICARATLFQAVYIKEGFPDVLQQVAVKQTTMAESSMHLNTDYAAPFMSFWAIKACQGLSWMGTRSVQTGPIFDNRPVGYAWERD